MQASMGLSDTPHHFIAILEGYFTAKADKLNAIDVL